jgi:hypothetical protein
MFETMLDMMGQVSVAMLRRSSHIEARARREAILALESRVSNGVSAKVPTIASSAVLGETAN